MIEYKFKKGDMVRAVWDRGSLGIVAGLAAGAYRSQQMRAGVRWLDTDITYHYTSDRLKLYDKAI